MSSGPYWGICLLGKQDPLHVFCTQGTYGKGGYKALQKRPGEKTQLCGNGLELTNQSSQGLHNNDICSCCQKFSFITIFFSKYSVIKQRQSALYRLLEIPTRFVSIFLSCKTLPGCVGLSNGSVSVIRTETKWFWHQSALGDWRTPDRPASYSILHGDL